MKFKMSYKQAQNVIEKVANYVPFTVDDLNNCRAKEDEWGWIVPIRKVKETGCVEGAIIYDNYGTRPDFEGTYGSDGYLIDGVYTTGDSAREIIVKRVPDSLEYIVELPWWNDSLTFRLQFVEAMLYEGLGERADVQEEARKVLKDFAKKYPDEDIDVMVSEKLRKMSQ